MSWLRLGLIAAVLAALAAGAAAARSHLIGVGEARVQARWNDQKEVDQAETLRLERERSAEQLTRFRNSERISDEQAKLAAASARRIAAGDAVAERLRGTLDRLDRRDVSTAGSDSRSIALAQEAATARELFGSCTESYRSLAAAADSLRDQVAGLQADALYVGRAPTQTNTTEKALEQH